MKNSFQGIILFFILITFCAFPKNANAQNEYKKLVVKTVKLKTILAEMQKNGNKENKDTKNDTTLIFNFWATWCVPCVKELPDFIKLANEAIENNTRKFIFVAVEDDLKKVEFFLEKKKFNVPSKYANIEFWLLDEHDANLWVTPIDDKWDGAIPFTMTLKKGQRKTHLGEIHYEALKKLLLEF